ncbi:hypothetical protein [Arsenicibacter rosenii]|uniref:Uncharacterized protein n=1 Tax=Arsenicibacter rosenii TaxID=1750698 RepID=A0A1S2VGX4_9BACT|nr:hypothetical protein [Arsenicibacter rosenii]OIN57138.1 hypothetical protein BLX24_21545 [Arsenicibacter rosenii]
MHLFNLLSDALRMNIIHDNAYKTRMNGFASESFFSRYLSDRQITSYQGGYLVPVRKKSSALDNFVYFTCISNTEEPADYQPIYQALLPLRPVCQFLIVYENERFADDAVVDVAGRHFPLPVWQVYRFRDGAFVAEPTGIDALLNLFTDTNQPAVYHPVSEQLVEVARHHLAFLSAAELFARYVDRFIFDVLIGRQKTKGVPTDIDVIVRQPGTEQLVLIEVKEKDLAKTISGFGLDEHRMRAMKQISDRTGLRYSLVVRHIRNQHDRAFIGWKRIEINAFLQHRSRTPIEGGKGMRSMYSYNPTYICPVGYFKEI